MGKWEFSQAAAVAEAAAAEAAAAEAAAAAAAAEAAEAAEAAAADHVSSQIFRSDPSTSAFIARALSPWQSYEEKEEKILFF